MTSKDNSQIDSKKHSWSTDVQGLEYETAEILQKYGRPKTATRPRSMRRIDYSLINKQRVIKCQTSLKSKILSSSTATRTPNHINDAISTEKKNNAAKTIQQFLRGCKEKSKRCYSSIQTTRENAQLRLFNENGSVNLSLRAAVADALKTHRFDSVPSILLHEHFGQTKTQQSGVNGMDNVLNQKYKHHRFYSEEKRLVSNISFTGPTTTRKGKKKTFQPTGTQGDMISIRNVPYPGMDKRSTMEDGNHSVYDKMNEDKSREVCFNCWSAYNNTHCNLKKNVLGKGKGAGCNLPFCDNWGIRHIRQCYRCEDIEERHSTDLASLRFVKDSRRRSTLSDEESHPILKSLLEHVEKVNLRARRRFHVSQWLSSFIGSLKLNMVDLDRNSDSGKRLREKGTKKNVLYLRARVNDIRDKLPQAPVTETDDDEDSIIKTKTVLTESGTEEWKLFVPVEPVPKPEALYMPKRYEMPPVAQVRLNGDDEGVELYGFFGKKRTENNMAIGGFSGEVIMKQKVLHYTPPEYGDFNIIETTTISPPTLPESYVPPNTLIIEPKKLEYVERELQHPLNNRRPPTVTLKVGISDDERHYFGPNRPEQTGETSDTGFRTSESAELPPIDSEIKTTAFTPSSDVVSPNTPKELPTMTTTTDLDYPFCETPSRQNTIEDLAYILRNHQPFSTFNKPQTFTITTKQEPGKFMFGNDDSLPLGRLQSIITRSWSFLQKKRIAQFSTRNGVPYWYDRHAGRTFWERPLCEEETLPVNEGGVVIGSRENSYLDGSIDFNDVIKSRSTIRRLILSQTDIGPKRKRTTKTSNSTRKSFSNHAVNHETNVQQNNQEQVETKKESPFERTNSENSLHSKEIETNHAPTTKESDSGSVPGEMNTEIVENKSHAEPNLDPKHFVSRANEVFHDDGYEDLSSEENLEIEVSSSQSGQQSSTAPLSSLQTNLQQATNNTNSTQLVSSIADALGGMLKGFSNETDVLKLGVGLGLSLSAQGILNLRNGEEKISSTGQESIALIPENPSDSSKQKDVEENTKNQDDDIVFPIISASSSSSDKYNSSIIPQKNDTLDGKNLLLSHQQEEEEAAIFETSDHDSCTRNEEESKADVTLLKAAFKTHKPYDTGETIIKYDQTNVEQEEGALQGLSRHVSPRFLEAIKSTRVGKQYVDYIPSSPNLPQCNPVGRVKPRSAGKDWMAIGFDPWSAGKELLSVEFVPFLVVSEESNTNIIPAVAPKDAVSYLVRETKESNSENKKFKQLSSSIRHGNYHEFELTLEEFGDTFPIDATDDVGNTLLMVSCQNGNKRMVKLCLRKGSDVNKQNTNGHTSLHYAFGYGFADLGAYLISKGADDTIANAEGLTCYEGLRMEDISSF